MADLVGWCAMGLVKGVEMGSCRRASTAEVAGLTMFVKYSRISARSSHTDNNFDQCLLNVKSSQSAGVEVRQVASDRDRAGPVGLLECDGTACRFTLEYHDSLYR